MTEIRLAKYEDLNFVKDAYKKLDEAMMSLYSEIVNVEDQEDDNVDMHTDEYWMRLISSESGYILIGLEDKSPVGMAVIEKVDEQECHLEDLYVYEQYRNRGMGKQLLNKAMNKAKEMGFRNMSLNVLPNNGNARVLYKGLGFKDTRIRMSCNLKM